MGGGKFKSNFWTQNIKIPLYGYTLCLIYVLTKNSKNRKSRFSLKPEVRSIWEWKPFSYTETKSLIILIPNLGMLTTRGRHKVVCPVLVKNALQRHHVTACTSYYHRCAQFFMHIQMAYSVFVEKISPKTLCFWSIIIFRLKRPNQGWARAGFRVQESVKF